MSLLLNTTAEHKNVGKSSVAICSQSKHCSTTWPQCRVFIYWIPYGLYSGTGVIFGPNRAGVNFRFFCHYAFVSLLYVFATWAFRDSFLHVQSVVAGWVETKVPAGGREGYSSCDFIFQLTKSRWIMDVIFAFQFSPLSIADSGWPWATRLHINEL